MKQLVLLILILLLITTPVFSQEQEFDLFPGNKGSIYEYTDDNVPDVCFFPIAKARWNGYEITNKNWGQLTDYQKVVFVVEGMKEIKRHEDAAMQCDDPLRMVVALNAGVEMMKKEMPDTEVAMIRFLIDTLKKDGFIK